MRVALVAAGTVPEDPSDGAARLKQLSDLLVARGHEVVVFSAKWWDGSPGEFEFEDVTYRAVVNSPAATSYPARLVARVRSMNPDVVHAVCDPPSHLYGAKWAATVSRAPLVVECYDPPRERSLFGGTVYRSAMRSAGAVVTPSRTIKTRVRESGVPGDGVRVVPTGIDFETVRSIEPTPSGDIVYSRHLDQHANLGTLLLALAEFRTYDWRATIVGDGPERANFERQTRDLRIADRVEFVGEKDVAERIALFKSAHVYVHTAEYTPFAVDLLRALAAGCVAVVEYHEDSSAHELIEHEDRGFTATSAQELTDRLTVAGDLERLEVDEGFASYDERSFLERYLEIYRTLQGR